MVVQEFLNVVSEEWEVNEEEWKAMKYVKWEKMHKVWMYVCDVVMMSTTALQSLICVAAENEGSWWGESRREDAGGREERQGTYVAGCGERSAA
ncbi:uncharacterized protein MONOS_7358 [Monocercomonoides exilis]|uniref:uncharacterized protein n=1 Tax=Monocercomonoides exilis TaxID=2049356 RepID=UPI003559FCC2|nr:hypothetical protein MONOS_7358 [Monocercomonoides exilis]|eukprot:MONOS_7358.1-p1 / transcript=MONOS_7358.1 / gene=MONOS_7358 / organism=Monocercomonoides_exilis_PA203 / gene_product=unspecified product / transcript_product=unspecified product / location=Mono_scaffold00249:53921-54377(+) / protein_length=94 / sequence_SO=supercontig / SO=protein_coding / is_pseudo=false